MAARPFRASRVGRSMNRASRAIGTAVIRDARLHGAGRESVAGGERLAAIPAADSGGDSGQAPLGRAHRDTSEDGQAASGVATAFRGIVKGHGAVH